MKKIVDYTEEYTGKIELPKKYKQLLGYLEIRESNAEKYMAEHNGWFFCSQKEMCENTGIPERTINRLLKTFVKEGLLLRQSGHRGFASEYKILYCHGLLLESGRLDKITTMADQDCQNHCNYTDEETVIEKVADQDCQVNKSGRPFTLTSNNNLNKQSITKSSNSTHEVDLVFRFVLDFLEAGSREEAIGIYKDYISTHTLQDEERDFLVSYTSKVGDLKGWHKKHMQFKVEDVNRRIADVDEEMNHILNTKFAHHSRIADERNRDMSMGIFIDYDVKEAYKQFESLRPGIVGLKQKWISDRWQNYLKTIEEGKKQPVQVPQGKKLSDEEKEQLSTIYKDVLVSFIGRGLSATEAVSKVFCLGDETRIDADEFVGTLELTPQQHTIQTLQSISLADEDWV